MVLLFSVLHILDCTFTSRFFRQTRADRSDSLAVAQAQAVDDNGPPQIGASLLSQSYNFRIVLNDIDGVLNELILVGTAYASENSDENDPNTIFLAGMAQISAAAIEGNLIGTYNSSVELNAIPNAELIEDDAVENNNNRHSRFLRSNWFRY